MTAELVVGVESVLVVNMAVEPKPNKTRRLNLTYYFQNEPR